MNPTFMSDISHKEFPMTEKISGEAIRPTIMQLILQDYPSFTADQHISIRELNNYRERYIATFFNRQQGEQAKLDKEVMSSITSNYTLTDKVNEESESPPTRSQRIADKVANFGGSWTFLILIGTFFCSWIILNAAILANRSFDPYPFILLNLILSCMIAAQTPMIMMSQKRQVEKDRERARNDYMINLKAELEVRALHEKVDHLMMHQQQELIEIQKIQVDLLCDIKRVIDINEPNNPSNYF